MSNLSEMRIALFAGSFNPFTIGHAAIVERAFPLFDRIVIAVGVNADKSADDIEQRINPIKQYYHHRTDISVIAYRDRLTVDLAREVGAKWLLRGVRTVKDFEYERDLADINRKISGIETIVLFTLPEHQAISSSVVRELQAYGHDVSSMIP